MSLHCIVWCCRVLYCWLRRAGCISQDTYLLYQFLISFSSVLHLGASLTHFGAYHPPLDGHFLLLRIVQFQDWDRVPSPTLKFLAMLVAGDRLRVTLLLTLFYLALDFVMATPPAAALSTVQQKRSVTSTESANPQKESTRITPSVFKVIIPS